VLGGQQQLQQLRLVRGVLALQPLAVHALGRRLLLLAARLALSLRAAAGRSGGVRRDPQQVCALQPQPQQQQPVPG
jgi:hypothetical protein